MPRVLAWLLISLAATACTPRHEAWRYDRADGVTSLLLQKNWDWNTPLLIEIDFRTSDIHDGAPLDLARASYAGLARLDYSAMPPMTAESHRYRYLSEQEFEGFMHDHLVVSSPPGWRAGGPYTGTVTLLSSGRKLHLELHCRDVLYNFIGDCGYKDLIGNTPIEHQQKQ